MIDVKPNVTNPKYIAGNLSSASDLGLQSSTPSASQDANLQIIESTSSKIRSFLYELAEGTTNYRSLHSLTEQVEHQYHGRFIVELIQNAHDAMCLPGSKPDQPARIEVVFKNEGKFGALYVANDGRPFSASNFNSLSQLGQSDKKPQDSIGNKGIGFRSVLEVTDAPEIYSRSAPSSPHFDGFCFAFSPEVIHRLTDPVLALLNGNDAAVSPFGNAPLVDWNVQLLTKFRASVTRIAMRDKMPPEAWLKRELNYLSPYLLPFPKNSRESGPIVSEFERREFATLIRFPLKNAAIQSLVREKLDELDNTALLFLEKISSLALDSGDKRRELSRHQVERPSLLNGREVIISEGSNDRGRRYWVWTRGIALADAPDNVQTALQQLPGKWPELQDATVSIGVALGENPEPGALSIFLPTLLGTGCATHINAPFFGDMSRTHIDFGTVDDKGSSSDAIYNRFLLSEAARLAISVVHKELAGGGLDEARVIVDLLTPYGTDLGARNRWYQLTVEAAEASGVDINTIAWFLSDCGWKALSEIKLLPAVEFPSVLTPKVLRQHAAFAAYVEGLESRQELIEALSEARGIGVGPANDDLASTVESIALDLQKNPDADWNGFWSDVPDLFDEGCSALAGKRILLGNDGQLHSGSSKDCTVFFIPRKSASDDEEIENDGVVKEIPPTLRPFVAFLSELIQVYEEKDGRLQQTRIRKFLLESKLVSQFSPIDILNDVLLARTPSLPVPLSGSHSSLCQDILLWALRLMAYLADRDKDEKSLRLLKNIPAPCKGGWYPLAESAFGQGWLGTQGDVTNNYLSLVRTEETREAKKRLLLPPSDERWVGNGAAHITLLRLGGVFDGLRLIPINPKSWGSRFQANKDNFMLPQNPPPAWSEKDWNQYRSVAFNDARPSYNCGTYEIQRLYAFPGIDKYQELDEDARMSVMKVVLGSAERWEDRWDKLVITRVLGNPDQISSLSPLAYLLRKLSWLGLADGDATKWYRPAERWHVPTNVLAGGRKWQFEYLRPLPGELANRLDTNSRLSEVMRQLGTPRFDPETKSVSNQLLDALVSAVVRNEVPHRDVFLGHVRLAWRIFYPGPGSAFPQQILVQRGNGRLTAEIPSTDKPVYLPDSAKSFLSALKQFNLPVIAIETEVAKRLADHFTAAFPGGVFRASELQPVPLVEEQQWDETPLDRLRGNSEFEWVIPVLLSIAAFHGPQSQGTSSKSFRKQLETFRNAKLSVVGNIKIGLFHGELPIAPPIPVPALWWSESQTLLISGDSLENPDYMSEALSHLLDREDLETQIKLVLKITGPQAEHKNIILALKELKVSEEHFNEVREQWRGDLGQIIEKFVPLLTILRPDANIGALVELDTDDAVTEFLNQLGDDRFNGKSLVRMARDSSDMFDFGSKAFLRFGDAVQMSKWNAALLLRDEPPLTNRDASTTFKAHFSASAQVLRSLLAALVARRPEVGTFRSLSEQLDFLVCPEGFNTDYWDVSFSQALSVAIPLLQECQAKSEEIAAVRESASTDELIKRLAASGVDEKFDPLQAARDNREQLQHELVRLQQIGLAWALGSAYPNPVDWESRVGRYLDYLSHDIEATAYTCVWSDQDILAFLRKLPVDEPSITLWSALAAASDLDDLIVRLGLSAESLSNANIKLDALREDARQRKKIIKICGKEFDSSEDNLSGLWTHICSELPAAVLSELAPMDLKTLSSLENMAMRAKSKPKEREPTNKSKQKHLSRSMENLIGLSGEIHAFRMLQNTYSASAVSASSWVSGNSALVFPDNSTDDSRGCDFIVTLSDRTYFIEVKSSEGDQESFTLGSSEIRLAMDLAKKSPRRRKEIFLVLRIANALTNTPVFKLLPNPYDARYQPMFFIEEADARVRYKVTG
ncbi:MAG: sacsin N-terminal ATP-binding-like domain-containing protein [Leptospirales bacterium]